MDKLAVARALREIGMLLEAKGENPFKVRAYASGARALEDAPDDLPSLLASGRLLELRGIGEALAKKIDELRRTGHTSLLDRLREELPPGVVGLMGVPELGPKKVAALRQALGITSVAELEAACKAGRVREVKGFGVRTEARILESLSHLPERQARILLSDALELGERLLVWLREPGMTVELAGSARRMKETVGDLDLVASADPGLGDGAAARVSERLLAFPLTAETLARGDTKTSVRLVTGVQVDLRTVAREDLATALHHFTGSKGHHVKLRGLARERGYSLSEYGLAPIAAGSSEDAGPEHPGAGDAEPRGRPEDLGQDTIRRAPPRIRIASEAELYASLGLPFIPPELREDEGEIEAGLAGTLPEDLVREEDVRGAVHCHTRWSDGRASLEEMAAAADRLGLEYLTVTDHSPSAHYAGGLTVDRLKQQWDEIARVQERVRVKLLRGTESDITEEGALDFPDAVMEQLGVVIASVHSRFKMDERAMTRRIVRAMEHPIFKIWGHACGRLLLEREPFACRVEEVLDAIARSRGAVEVNGDPKRLELEPRWLRAARERGIPVVLSVDAHSVGSLGYLRYAVAVARRGWVRRGDVLNTLDASGFARAVRPVL